MASGTAMLAFRAILARWLQPFAAAGRLTFKFAVIGATAAGQAFLDSANGDSAIQSVGVYDDASRDLNPSGLPIRGSIADLLATTCHTPLDAVVIAVEAGKVAAVRQQLLGLSADIFVAPGVAHARHRLAKLGSTPVIPLALRPLQEWRGVRKAVFDRVGSAVLLLLALPLLCIIALAVWLSSPGPVLFRQAREGLHGESFTMFKFRTMRHDNAADQSVQAIWRDPRVTPVGFWLRRTSLDELPQLFNVLRGDMSLVGPRPHFAAHALAPACSATWCRVTQPATGSSPG